MTVNIWVAAADNNIQVVEEHIKSGNFTANSKDPNGYTPIHAAASYGHIELLKMLIKEYNGDINIQDNEGDSPLHHVEDLQVAKTIVEDLKADYKIKNNDNLTPSQYIEEEDEFPEVASYLISLSYGDNVAKSDSLLASLPQPGEVDGHNIRYSLQESQPESEMDSEKRRKIEAIINGDNPEEALRELIKDAVHQQFNQLQDDGLSQESPALKKKRS